MYVLLFLARILLLMLQLRIHCALGALAEAIISNTWLSSVGAVSFNEAVKSLSSCLQLQGPWCHDKAHLRTEGRQDGQVRLQLNTTWMASGCPNISRVPADIMP